MTRWFITSRDAHNIGKALGANGIRLVDLEDEKYGSQVQIALKKIAKSKVELLVKEKEYNKALAYFVSSIIGKRAQNTQWIEISCVQLYELPARASDLKVRRVLETMPQDLRDLLNNAWRQVFRATDEDSDTIQELLRALVLTYETPTAQELGVLAGLCTSEAESEELRRLVEMCKPLLVTDTDGKVSFMNTVVKSHLLQNAEELLDMSEEEVKLQHGLLALRCLEHVKEVFGTDNDLAIDEETDSESESDDEGSDEEEDDDDDEEEDEEEEGEEDDDDEEAEGVDGAERPPGPAMEYAVKHWLHHASKATFGMAENLGSEHEDFWMPESHIRRRWLTQFYSLTSSLESVFWLSNVKRWTAIHVASAFGFQGLVATLIRNGHEDEIAKRDEGSDSPVCDRLFTRRSRAGHGQWPTLLTQTPVTFSGLLRPYQDSAGAVAPRCTDKRGARHGRARDAAAHGGRQWARGRDAVAHTARRGPQRDVARHRARGQLGHLVGQPRGRRAVGGTRRGSDHGAQQRRRRLGRRAPTDARGPAIGPVHVRVPHRAVRRPAAR